jgi:hypothetical protein
MMDSPGYKHNWIDKRCIICYNICMVETPQFPPDPESKDDKFLAGLRRQVLWANNGQQALQGDETSQLLIKEATPPDSGAPNPKLLGMLLEREELIDQMADRQVDPTSAQDQLSALQQDIYSVKSESGIPVVDTPNLPLDNDN